MPEKLDRCVRKVKAQRSVKNPWAVCKAAFKKKRHVKQKRKMR